MNKKTKIIFFGTPEFAVPALQALLTEGYNFILVITQTDKPTGRKQALTPSPVKLEAQRLGLTVVEKLGAKEILAGGQSAFGGKIFAPDLGIVVAYGKIIPQKILDLFPLGVLNIHPSLLPKYRGPAPIQNAILNGDAETGVSIMQLDDKMDHGPILTQEKYSLTGQETYPDLSDKLSEIGAKLLIKILPAYLENKIELKPQDDSQATVIKMIERDDGLLDFNKSALVLERQIRAYAPWPGCFAEFIVKGKKIVIKIITARADDVGARRGAPAPVDNQPAIGQFSFNNGQLLIQCGHGALVIKKLQPEGKKEITAEEFINGYLK